MPEKVDEKAPENESVVQEEESGEREATDPQDDSKENGHEQDGGDEKPKEDKQEESEQSEAPKRRGRKSKEDNDGPDTKKPKKETKTPERVSTRVRNRSTGEKLPDFKDMKDLPSPTRRKSKSDAKDEEKPAPGCDAEQIEATS